MSTTGLRQRSMDTKVVDRQRRIDVTHTFKNMGYSNVTIAEKLNVSESTVRRMLQQPANKKTFTPLPRDEDGFIKTSASYGHTWVVHIQWNTDYDHRPIDPEMEDYPVTMHGDFESFEEAQEWMDAYPDDTDVHDMNAWPLNLVR